MGIVQRAKQVLFRQEETTRDEAAVTLCTLVCQEALEQLGREPARPLTAEQAAALIHECDPAVDIQASIELAVKRYRWADKCADFEELEKAANEADRELREFRAAEEIRVHQARDKISALRVTAIQLANRYAEAVGARSELLATGDEGPDERKVADQLAANSQSIERCQAVLDHLAADSSATALRVARGELGRTNPRNKRHADLQATIKHHEGIVAERTKELASLRKQHEQLQTKLRKLSLARLKPENFKIVRRVKSQLERLAAVHAGA